MMTLILIVFFVDGRGHWVGVLPYTMIWRHKRTWLVFRLSFIYSFLFFVCFMCSFTLSNKDRHWNFVYWSNQSRMNVWVMSMSALFHFSIELAESGFVFRFCIVQTNDLAFLLLFKTIFTKRILENRKKDKGTSQTI